MRMLKKLSACAVAGAMAMAFGAVSSFAAGSVSVGNITAVKGEDNVYTVTVPYTATDVDQVTLLGSIAATADAAVPADITYSNTAFIDQEAQDGSFVFKVDASRFTAANPWLQIRLGGTGLDAAVSGTAQELYVAPAPATPITSADVTGGLLKGDDGETAVTTVFGKANTGIMRLDVSQLIANSKIDLATQTITIDGIPAVYTVYNGVTKLVTFVDTTVADHEIAVVDGASTRLKYGDANGDLSLDAADISRLINDILANKSLSALTDLSFVRDDSNGDLAVNAGDISSLIQLILDENRIPAADK